MSLRYRWLWACYSFLTDNEVMTETMPWLTCIGCNVICSPSSNLLHHAFANSNGKVHWYGIADLSHGLRP